MKRASVIAFGLFLFGVLLLVSGCQKRDCVPLSEDAVTSLLAQVGLPGEISPDETVSQGKGRISYVIRDPAETYGDGGSSKMVAGVTSLVRKDGRALSATFVQNVAEEPIVWEDWERQIKLAVLLYGGFEDEEDLYKACTEAELPTDTASFSWETERPEGYCRVTYRTQKYKTYDERNFEVVNHSATMWVSIYESRAFYEKLYPDDRS